MNEEKQIDCSLWEIFTAFFKMGIVTFGGGYAMLPILERDVVEKRGWTSKEQVMDFYAVSQGLPGIIAVNVSVFIGYRCRKIPGAVAAALGVVAPCILIITIIAACLRNFQDNIYVRRALAGISVCVSALIISTVMGMWKKGVKDLPGLLIFFSITVISLFTSVNPIFCVIGAAVAGILIQEVKRRRKA